MTSSKYNRYHIVYRFTCPLPLLTVRDDLRRAAGYRLRARHDLPIRLGDPGFEEGSRAGGQHLRPILGPIR